MAGLDQPAKAKPAAVISLDPLSTWFNMIQIKGGGPIGFGAGLDLRIAQLGDDGLTQSVCILGRNQRSQMIRKQINNPTNGRRSNGDSGDQRLNDRTGQPFCFGA